LRAHFEACARSTLSAWLERAYSDRFSALAMELLGRRSLDEEALLLFFISRHLTPALAPRMSDLFCAIILVQPAAEAVRVSVLVGAVAADEFKQSHRGFAFVFKPLLTFNSEKSSFRFFA
jgi:hypothetical protein